MKRLLIAASVLSIFIGFAGFITLLTYSIFMAFGCLLLGVISSISLIAVVFNMRKTDMLIADISELQQKTVLLCDRLEYINEEIKRIKRSVDYNAGNTEKWRCSACKTINRASSDVCVYCGRSRTRK